MREKPPLSGWDTGAISTPCILEKEVWFPKDCVTPVSGYKTFFGLLISLFKANKSNYKYRLIITLPIKWF